MKIALDCRSVYHGCGGIGRYAANLARSLAALDGGHEYLHIFTSREGAEVDTSSEKVESLRFACGMIDEIFDQIHLPTGLARSRVDLYHGTCFSIPVPKCVKWRVATIHDVVFRRHPELVDPGLAGFLDRATEFAVLGADAVITVSEFSKREIVELCGANPQRIHVIPNGVEKRFFQPVSDRASQSLRKKLRLPERFVLYIGALEEKKNVPRLLRAWRLIREREPSLPHVLALSGGQGGKQYDVTKDVEWAGVADSVRLLGRVDDNDLPALYSAAHVFVYPSLYEGFGLPPLEAMAVGTPTLVSDSSSLPEVVGDGARVVSATSEEEIAQALVDLIAGTAGGPQLVECGKERARRFTWEECARKTLEVYEELEKSA